MMEEVAKVLSQDDTGWVTVEVKVKNACNHCDNNESCGTSAVAKAFSPKVQQFSVEATESYNPGDLLKLGLPESVLLKAAALVYLLPLFGLFVGAAFAHTLLPLLAVSHSDVVVIPLALLFAFAAWRWAKSLAARMEQDAQPIILAKLGRGI
ncbi:MULTISPECIES: SoxR reducing system RseC family protein [Shewanella]|uniref:SoxR reducing system RseC family protein n=1 Tax=Shewanella TaxID=22 RepID=UPI00048C6201|nr:MULTISPECIES: SoxR reducing system RseC family protein [Shewanella]QLE84583.1 SoxR reducing system RseC family protein [Shewanella sp. Scap07]